MVKIILPNKKCFLSPGSAFLRTRAGCTTISQNAVWWDTQQMFAEDLPDWGLPREVTLLAPFRIQPAYAHRWGHWDHCLLSRVSSFASPGLLHKQWLLAVMSRASALHDPGWMHLAPPSESSHRKIFSASLLSPSVCHWITRKGRWCTASTSIN